MAALGREETLARLDDAARAPAHIVHVVSHAGAED